MRFMYERNSVLRDTSRISTLRVLRQLQSMGCRFCLADLSADSWGETLRLDAEREHNTSAGTISGRA